MRSTRAEWRLQRSLEFLEQKAKEGPCEGRAALTWLNFSAPSSLQHSSNVSGQRAWSANGLAPSQLAVACEIPCAALREVKPLSLVNRRDGDFEGLFQEVNVNVTAPKQVENIEP